MATTLHHWKNGATFEGSGGRFSDVTNPATGEVSAQLALASEDDVNAVVGAAADAFPGWRDTSLARRTQILFKEIELFASQLSTIASIATFLSSMSWAGLMMGPPQLTLTPQFGGVAIRAYYYVVTLAFGTNIFTVATATFVLVWGCVVARIRAVRGVRGKVARGSVRRRRESRVPARDACRHRIALLLPPRVARQQRASRR